jgi:FkbM family methyltransferase
MREQHGWYFPDIEKHFPEMLAKNIKKGGPAEYQQPVRLRSLEYVKTKKVALDIGANVGLWSRDLVKHFEQVIAFEPVSMFRECLEKNVISEKLVIQSIALGDTNGTTSMIITEGNTGHTHVDPNSAGGDTVIQRLDSLNLPEVDYIKIDCEGFEYRVLQGAIETIRRCRPVIVIEQKPHEMYSKDYGQYAAIGLLEDWGMVKLDRIKDDWIMGWR